ncbi:hypothetical protein QR98_0096660 [Sarcoptes scabiei]|uniref:Uncharacterized protein n=1 Tax=Sarcoptes scabiei TaxID=52283 RepID=A0A132AJU7_SARSC|nr:hypothetical protein QR98_0096660 [Sarcoptes scabiei]
MLRRTCIGRREALQICQEILVSDHSRPASAMTDFYEQFCPSYSRKNVDEYASAICQKYQIKFSSLLSGRGRQLIGPQNHGCVVSCEDRLWKDVHYQMDAFADGRFPFGTDCSFGNRLGYCLNDSVLHRQEIMQLFAPSTVSSVKLSEQPSFIAIISRSICTG